MKAAMRKAFGRQARHRSVWAVPSWLLLFALLAASAGAALGVTLSGLIARQMVSGVSQALLVERLDVLGANKSFTAVSDDKAGFTVAAEIYSGDSYSIQAALSKRAPTPSRFSSPWKPQWALP